MSERDEFLRRYLDELTYLRQMGKEFARLYPKVAARLEMADGQSADPHVERLVESFAFLTARLDRRLDLELPEISSGLLEVLHPNLVNPVPPLAVARFEPDFSQGKATTGRVIPRHTRLFAQTRDGIVCRFRTAYPVELWPLEVTDVSLLPRSAFDVLDARPDVVSVLRVRLEPRGVTLADLDLKRLRFHFHGDTSLTGSLYEMLGPALLGVALVTDATKGAVFLPESSVVFVGFDPEEDVIPAWPYSQPGHRLLQEYLQFPAKFNFCDVTGLDRCKGNQRLDVLFLFRQSPTSRLPVDKDTVLLGCTPIQNLFLKTTEPIRIDQRRSEYRVVPDLRREAITEIHSILAVSASSDPEQKKAEVQPFFSFRHAPGEDPQTVCWHARRAPTGRTDVAGTDLWLSFVDLSYHPEQPPSQVVYAHTLCTNRDLAVQFPPGAPLQIEDAAPVARVTCLTRPTPTTYPATGGATLWKLISNLSLNHLSLSNGPENLEALREVLRLYNFSGSPTIDRHIDGIREMHTRPVTGRIGAESWRGFCRGTQVTLVFDETHYVGGSAVLFASVLHRFFALHTGINSFTQVVMRSLQREQDWKRWPPLAGSQPVF